MPVVIFFACLDLELKSSFMDGHCPTPIQFPKIFTELCFKAVTGIDVACLQYYGFFGHFSNA
jgi:hypothetical protein